MVLRFLSAIAGLCFVCSLCAISQESPAVTSTQDQLSSAPASHAATVNDDKEAKKLPAGSRIYVSPMEGGFETFVIAGLQQKKVPVIVVADRTKADFEISGVSESDKAGWAKMLFMGSQQSREQASIKVVNIKTGVVAFAYSVSKGNSYRGRQSAGEACAKHIKEKIEGRQD